jgi:hypothetical protein
MRKNRFSIIIKIVFILLIIFLYQSCDDVVNAPQDYISGTVNFIDTNLTYTNGYYAITVFPDSTNPYHQSPIAIDSLTIIRTGNSVSANYRVNGLASGSYYIGSTWIRNSDKSIRAILGVYGCDTAKNCTGTLVSIPNYQGSNSCNLLSWTDTLKNMH